MELLVFLLFVVTWLIITLKWPKTIEISDDAPESGTAKDAWLKLQNEGAEFVKFKDGKVYLKIVK